MDGNLALIAQSAKSRRERFAQSVHQCHLADHGSLFAAPKRFACVIFTELDFLIAGAGAVLSVNLRPAAEKGLSTVPIVDNGALAVQQLTVSCKHDDTRFKAVIGRVTLCHLHIAVFAQHDGACGILVLVVVVDQIGFFCERVQVILLASLQKDLAFGVGGLGADEIPHVSKAHGEVLTIRTGDLHRYGRGRSLQGRAACTACALQGTVCHSLGVGNGRSGRSRAGSIECHKELPPKLFDRTVAETALCGSLLEPCDIFPGELHPEAVLLADRCLRLGRLCKALKHAEIQSSIRRDGCIGLCRLSRFCGDLAFFIGRGGNNRCRSLRALCGLPFGLCAALCIPGVLTAAVLHKGSVQIQFAQILRGACFGILAAGLSDQPQFFPPGLHTLAQLPAGLCQVVGLVEPLCHQQTVEGDQFPQFSDAVGIDSLQRVLLILPFCFFHRLHLLVNGPGDGLALGLHLLCALQKLLQRLHVKGLCAAGGIAELLVQLVHGGTVGLGVFDCIRGVDPPGIGRQHLGQILLHLGLIPPNRGQFRVLHPDSKFVLHKYSPPLKNSLTIVVIYDVGIAGITLRVFFFGQCVRLSNQFSHCLCRTTLQKLRRVFKPVINLHNCHLQILRIVLFFGVM
nr:MAG TPA: hypothetical protein [Caudoviricetes sp.]